jgi:transposase
MKRQGEVKTEVQRQRERQRQRDRQREVKRQRETNERSIHLKKFVDINGVTLIKVHEIEDMVIVLQLLLWW